MELVNLREKMKIWRKNGREEWVGGCIEYIERKQEGIVKDEGRRKKRT